MPTGFFCFCCFLCDQLVANIFSAYLIMHKTLHGQISKKFSGLENYFSVSCVSYIEAIHIKLFAKSFNSEGNLFLVSIQNVPLNNFFQVQWVFKKCLKFSYSICFKSNFVDQQIC